jgi:hypothetical protein
MAENSAAKDGKGTAIGPIASAPESPSARNATDVMNGGVYITIMATLDGQVEESFLAVLNLEYFARVLGLDSTPKDVIAVMIWMTAMIFPIDPEKVGGKIMFEYIFFYNTASCSFLCYTFRVG